jgi:hypothetical protein
MTGSATSRGAGTEAKDHASGDVGGGEIVVEIPVRNIF